KQKGPTATAAVAAAAARPAAGRLVVVGLGPGGAAHRTPAAVAAVRGADAVVGYGPYVDAVAGLLRPDQRVVRSTMGAESERAAVAVALAVAGWRVALVSSGDAGVFGMASTALDAALDAGDLGAPPIFVEVVPGVTAAHAAAAAAGAPLAGAHAAITLSDLLTPWARIEAQLRAAAGSGLALALYNPRSKGRPDHLARAVAVLAEVLPGETPMAVVTAAGDRDERVHAATLATLDPSLAGMRSVVLVGTADTVVDGAGRLVTSRHHPVAGDVEVAG
ncbi:MAG TPA: precorrin-3B C(17)-methyltransferase, partial [Aquihabitans sp.]|nr:precorrin-3B C(17)-methyltransferase [Aquihabitans sp.]